MGIQTKISRRSRTIFIFKIKWRICSVCCRRSKKYYKLSKKNPRWAVLVEAFDVYPYASVPERRKSIEQLIKTIKADLAQEKAAKEEEETMQLQRQKHPSGS